jgi:general secretion pathway protein D
MPPKTRILPAWYLVALSAFLAGCAEENQFQMQAVSPVSVIPAAAVELAAAYQRPLPDPPGPKLIETPTKTILIYSCRYAHCEILKNAMEKFVSPEGSAESSPALNTLVISDAKELVPGLLAMARELDRPVPQLLVEARIIEVTLDSDLEAEMNLIYQNLGSKRFLTDSDITLKTPGADPNDTQGTRLNLRPMAGDLHQLDAFIRVLVTKGKARILSSPNLIVQIGKEASIITGEEVPVQSATVVSGSVSTTTTFKRVGIKLRVTPQQIAGSSARLEINPEVSTVTGYTAPGASGVSNPIVALRNERTTLSVFDGEMLTIGGLLRDETREIVRKVPLVGDIPGLGLLFQSRRDQCIRTQLIFFLRINILPDGQPNAQRFHKPGAGMEGVDQRAEEAKPQPERQESTPMPAPEPEWIHRVPPPVEGPVTPRPNAAPPQGPAVPPTPGRQDERQGQPDPSSGGKPASAAPSSGGK